MGSGELDVSRACQLCPQPGLQLLAGFLGAVFHLDESVARRSSPHIRQHDTGSRVRGASVKGHVPTLAERFELEIGKLIHSIRNARTIVGRIPRLQLAAAGRPRYSFTMTAHILVVDDDRDMLALMAHALRGAGHRVRTAEDGADALRRIARDHFDLVVCDVLMPGLSGRSLGRQLAEQPDHPPLLYVSAAEMVPGMLPGAFLRKPFPPEALVAVVTTLLEQQRR